MSIQSAKAGVSQIDRHLRLVVGVLAIGVAIASVAALAGWIDHITVLAIVAIAASLMPVLLATARRLLDRRLEELQAAMTHSLASAHRDALTGTFTRSYFLDVLKSYAPGGSLEPIGYLQIDMDNLKVLNDSAGHGAGDAALVALVRDMRALMPQAVIGGWAETNSASSFPGTTTSLPSAGSASTCCAALTSRAVSVGA